MAGVTMVTDNYSLIELTQYSDSDLYYRGVLFMMV